MHVRFILRQCLNSFSSLADSTANPVISFLVRRCRVLLCAVQLRCRRRPPWTAYRADGAIIKNPVGEIWIASKPSKTPRAEPHFRYDQYGNWVEISGDNWLSMREINYD